jgi:hypothetical protein
LFSIHPFSLAWFSLRSARGKPYFLIYHSFPEIAKGFAHDAVEAGEKRHKQWWFFPGIRLFFPLDPGKKVG